KWFRYVLLGAGAVMLVAGTAGNVAAQPANCGDINGDGLIDSNDISALAAGTISPACAGTSCFDINGSGGAADVGDRVRLARFRAGGGTMAEPGRSAGEQNLLFRLCAPQPQCTAGTALPCNTPATPFTGAITSDTQWPGLAAGCSNFYIDGLVTVKN